MTLGLEAPFMQAGANHEAIEIGASASPFRPR
jgi:hypothetical protein